MKRRKFLQLAASTSLVAIVTPTGIIHAIPGEARSGLEEGFTGLRMSDRPYCMWMWMNGQVTRQGITLDLEAMARAGIGGVFNFESGSDIPKGPLQYLSDEWFGIKAFAFQEAARLGLEFAVHNCPGWSSSGGPWITPATSMKQTTWSKTYVSGGKNISLMLQPPTRLLDYYKDIVVVAYPSLKNEATEKPGDNNFTDWAKRTNLAYNAFGAAEIKTELESIESSKIINLTKMMSADGSFSWDAPTGDWTIIRFGFTTTGVINRAAPDSGIGLECDKYNAEAIEFHFYKMMSRLLPSMKQLIDKKQLGLEIDSFEVGMQNWTDDFEKEFEKRNGYSLLKYLPALTGKLVDNADITDRVLWDLRRMQADMIADNYYGKFAELCRKHKVTCYLEPYDRGPMEEMQVGARADSNLGEYWNGLSVWLQNNKTMRRTPKLISSIAHVNGQSIAGVEGLTAESPSAKWQEYGFAMKPVCDHIFTQGINRIVFHRYAHQPHPDVNIGPGMTHGDWGIHFERTNTMWDANKTWMDNLTRCQFLLRQGLFVADLAYYTGEDPGIYTAVNRDELFPSPPPGYDYDLINPESLLRKAKVTDGRLLLNSGMSYRILVLQQQRAISLEMLEKIAGFVRAGLIVIGKRPQSSPGLKTFSNASTERFKTLCDELWGTGKTEIVDRNVGNGRMIWSTDIGKILSSLNLLPDFRATSRSGDAPLKYLHRRSNDTEIFFVANQRRSAEDVACEFRVTGRQPELWDPVTGKIIVAPIFEEETGITRVSFSLMPYQSLFVVFREAVKHEAVKSISLDGRMMQASAAFNEDRKIYKDVADNFTLVCWAKPEMDVMLSTRAYYENVKGEWTDFYALYPPPGNKLYGDGHSACGFTIGRNGVSVWEHTSRQPKFIVGCPANLSGWSHVAIVYEQGFPSVYVNGILVGQGDKKTRNIVHPGLGGAYLDEGASYYNGDISTIDLYREVLSPERIRQLMGQTQGSTDALERIIEPLGDNTKWLFWKNGDYVLSKASGKQAALSIKTLPAPFEIKGSWKLDFPLKTGNPAGMELPGLISLKDHSDSAVKYFSGTINYRKEINIPAEFTGPGKRLYLDLGRVEVIAEVILNGKSLGLLWTRPYLAELTGLIRKGSNTLEIRVSNQWVNRLIGDEQHPETDDFSPDGNLLRLPEWYQKGLPKPDNGRVAFTTWKHFDRNSPLIDAGLIGPVLLRSAIEQRLG